MIPTMILFGLVLGWWWRTALIAAAVVWPLMLWQAGIFDGTQGVMGTVGLALGAALFGVANAGVGVAIDQGILALVRRIRRRGAAATPAA
jgi:uncharacterized membrane protein